MVRRAHLAASLAIAAGLFAACRDEPTSPRLRPAGLTPLSSVLLIDYGTATELVPPASNSLGWTEGLGLNAAGDVVGANGAHGPDYRPTLWPAGGGEPRFLPSPQGDVNGYATDINDAGDAVGWVWAYDEEIGNMILAVLWPAGGGQLRHLGALNAYNTEAYAINNGGDVVGTSGDHAVMWPAGGPPQKLGALPGTQVCAAVAINDNRDIAGSCSTGPGSTAVAVLWSAGVSAPRELPGLGGAQSVASGINAAGDVVGYSQTFGDGATHATLWPAGGGPVRDLGTLGESYLASEARAINDRGDIVGRSYTYRDGRFVEPAHAVLWPAGGGTPRDLGTLGRASSGASAINSAGQIVVQAGRSFLLTPSTAPPTGGGAPTLLLHGPYRGTEGSPLAFDRSTATDPDGDALTYAWDFGDGATGSDAHPSHTYVDDRMYTATLSVTDPTGHSTAASTTVIVDNAPPVVSGVGPDVTLVAGRYLTQSGSFSDAGTSDSPWTYHIYWGDGTSFKGSALAQGAQPAKNHTYTRPGIYPLEVLVVDKDGGASYATRKVTVVPNQPPVASANGPYTGNEGGNITFSSAGSSDANGDALKYRWSFGDGSTSTVANPTKKYADNGTYTVTLTVTDPSNATHTATTTAVVTNVAPTASLGAPSSIGEGVPYTVSISGSDVGTADRPTLEHALDCGLGVYGPWSTTAKSVSCPPLPDQLATPLTPRGKVRDKDGGEREVIRSLRVVNATPVVAFNATTPTAIAIGGSVSFQASFTDAGVNDQPWTWTVVWSDGAPGASGVATQPGDLGTLTHTYTKAGIFSAYLKVVDKDGSSRTSAKVAVTVSP